MTRRAPTDAPEVGPGDGAVAPTAWRLPVELPIDPMLAKLARSIPTSTPDGGWLFEPKWDGFRCIVARSGDRIELFSRNRKPLARYFPELLAPLRDALPDRVVVDGEIVVSDVDGRGLDFGALQQRLHPAASRVDRLAGETPSMFIAFDVIAVGDDSLMQVPMDDRRARLLEIVAESDMVRVTPASTDPAQATAWFGRFEGAGLDGVIAKPIRGTYEPGKRVLVKVKHERTADCAVAGYRVHKDGKGVGSLLLGLFDEHGQMRSVGVAASFTATRRAELLAELEPRTHDALVDHPWADWVVEGPGGVSRWNANKDLSFVPIRMGLVAEVTFGQLEDGRFRHGVAFQRWRPDRDPTSCTYDQLDVADPVDVAELFT